jgi:tetratricopeptide (TPR) repeat protein
MTPAVVTGTVVLDQVEALRRSGVEATDAGRYAKAAQLFRRALRRIDHLEANGGGAADRDLQKMRARIWISVATCESELNGHRAGLAALRTAQEYVDLTDDAHLRFLLLSQIGYMTVRGGEVEAGLAALDQAEKLLAYADPRDSYILYLNRGTTYLFQHQLNRAAKDFEHARDLAARNCWVTELRMVQHNLGYLAYLRGNLAEALQTMTDGDGSEEPIFRAVVLLDRSQALIETGLHREADEALQLAADLFRSERLWKDVGQVELARAECALLAGEHVHARKLALDARARFRRLGNERLRREADLLILQAEVSGQLRRAHLADAAEALRSEFESSGPPIRARTAALLAAEVLSREGSRTAAAAVVGQAGRIRPDDPIGVRAHTRVVRAELAAESGDVAKARRDIAAGLADLANHQARFGSIDMQTAGAIHGKRLVELDIELALRSGRPRNLFDAIERGRAVASRLSHVTAPVDDETAELLGRLRQVVSDLRAMGSAPGSSAAVDDLRRRSTQLQDALRARAWTVEGIGAIRPPASLDEVCAQLGAHDSVLISIVNLHDRMAAVVVSADGVRRVELGTATSCVEWARTIRTSLNLLATGQLVEPVRRQVTASLDRALAQIDELTIRGADVGGRRVVLSLAGDLVTVPWGLAPSLHGCPVVVVPSATTWLEAARQAEPAQPATVAVFSGPGLQHATAEASAVGGYWPHADSYHAAKADRQTLSDALQRRTIVHIAAHGQHQQENPLFSHVQMDDGPLYAYELERNATSAEHVVLSACEVGSATVRPGDEPLGLTSVLLRLGTRSVVSGVAKVHDAVAAAVMTAYHRELAAGVDSAQALASAMSTATEVPAPFMCFGSAWHAAR